MTQFKKAKLQDGREYVSNSLGLQTTGYSAHTQRCYRCNQNKSNLGGKRHPILGLLCKSCVETPK
jgi:hypothetical protein